MKKIIVFVVAVVAACFSASAQDVIKFMGIPVDGSKTEMIEALKGKGFVYSSDSDCLIGEFNGSRSIVAVVDTKGIVSGIAVVYYATDTVESVAKTTYNYLLRQFKNSPKYVEACDNEYLSDTEDISYEITVNNKEYHAFFYPKTASGEANAQGLVSFHIVKDANRYNIFIHYINIKNRDERVDDL